MPEPTKRIDLRVGEFAISAEGFDNPVQPVKQILRFVQRLVEETPELAGARFALEEETVAEMLAEAARKLDLAPDALEATPALLVTRRAAPPEAAETPAAAAFLPEEPPEVPVAERPAEPLPEAIPEPVSLEAPEPDPAPEESFARVADDPPIDLPDTEPAEAVLEADPAESDVAPVTTPEAPAPAAPLDPPQPDAEPEPPAAARLFADPEPEVTPEPDPEMTPEPTPEPNLFADPEPEPVEPNLFAEPEPEPALAEPVRAADPAPEPAEPNIFGLDAAPAPPPAPAEDPTAANIFGAAPETEPDTQPEPAKPAPRWIDDPNEPAADAEAGLGRFDALLSRLRQPGGQDAPPDTPEPAGPPSDPGSSVSPSELAERAGASTVPDLLTVSAAWLTLVNRQSNFGRRDVMEVFDQIPGDHPRTLEARIKGYGKLVRNGVLVLVDDGRFALSQDERTRFRGLIG